ncbi:golgin subfamily B member 1 isoform X1 [Conger conger]|uniref:golgin subfamily B member 1 isoform X1 n=1 Tax=Conger conger TaxID=82655 RepID=UPI002A5A0A5D|nr:golgin subfamily B member 1 isoform X1 [Conger conger]
MLVQNLTRKVGDGEEKFSLLQEQTESLKELLVKEKERFEEKENMYKQNIQTFKDIILQKDNRLTEINQQHEQELFRLAAKSDASADLEQLLKALKQKLHEKEEVLLGKTQVIDVLQGEVDGRDQQIKELLEMMRRLQGEKDNTQSKLDAEKHVMRAQLRDLLQKHEAELRQAAETHRAQLEETHRAQLEETQRALRAREEMQGEEEEEEARKVTHAPAPADMPTDQKVLELEAQAKLKAEEASKSEAKFLKMKAWSKSRVKQLEDELRKAQSGTISPDVTALRSQISDLEEEREEMLCKLEQYDELKTKNEQLIAKLVLYEDQQRKMQADLEQVAKRAASQTSESGSVDELQSQVLEWQDMVAEAESARDQAREEKAALALRMSHIEEEREALASRQQELEEELAQARGRRPQGGQEPADSAVRSLQDDFEFDGKQSYQDPKCTLENTASMEGENMGGWWPEYSTPDTGLRSVLEELELERNLLQEQILGLEDRCQDLEDRLQLQARIESLQVTFDVDEEGRPFWVSQSETERLHGQLASLRSQQNRDAEKHQMLVTSLNEQLKGLSEMQESLETSLIEKEHMLAKTSEKLELIDSLRDSLKEKEIQYREVSEKLLQTEHSLTEVTKKCSAFEKQCSVLKTSVTELTQKLSTLKEKTHKQDATIESLQSDLEQTNDELDKLNSTHLEERAQLIHDLQSCEREIDNLKDILTDKDKEISLLSNNISEYAEQVLELKREMKDKEEALVHTETALTRAEQKAQILKDSQSSDQQGLNTKITHLLEQLRTTECELSEAKEQKELKRKEIEDLIKQAQEDNQTIQSLRGEIQKLTVNHHSHLKECESQISSLKGQMTASSQKLQESEALLSQVKESSSINEKLQSQLQDKEQMHEKELKSFKEERNKLLAEVDKHNKELQALSKQLEEQVVGNEQVKKEVQEKLETIALLEQKQNVIQVEAEAERFKLNQELKARDSENERLQMELKGKSENISELEISVNTLENTNLELKAVIERKAIELKEQKQLVADLSEKAAVTREENANLCSEITNLKDEREELRQKVAVGKRSLSELKEENNTVQSKISSFQIQNSEDRKVIDELLKEKKELTAMNEELSSARNTISQSLLEKTNECGQITKLLSESKESIAHLQEQVNLLNSQVEQLNFCVAEKEKIAFHESAKCAEQENQIRHLEETLFLLQEQSATLVDKDTALQQTTATCTSLQNEILQQKEFIAGLQSETESFRIECSRWKQSSEENELILRSKTEESQNYLDELNKSSQYVDTLRSKLAIVNENALKFESAHSDLKVTLENQISDNKKLKEENNFRQSEVARLQNQVQVLCEENQKLQDAIEKQEKELTEQKLLVEDIGRKGNLTLEENINLKAQVTKLSEQIQVLQQEVTNKDIAHSELLDEWKKAQSKISAYDVQHSENCKSIEALLKEKEELKKQNVSVSDNLLEKTNECCHLTKLLTGSKDTVIHLQEQVSFLKSQMDQLHSSFAEREKVIVDQKALNEAQKSQLEQLQETLSLLQEQSTALKSGLLEKDSTLQQMTSKCTSLENERLQQKQILTQVQSESESLRSECARLSQSLEDRELSLGNKAQECQNHLDDLSKSNKSIVSLEGQLSVANQELLKLESENLKNLEKDVTESNKLREQVAQMEDTIVDLKNNIQVLNEENCKMKIEDQNFAAEVSQKLKEIGALQSELSNKNTKIASLTEQLEKVEIALQQRTESMNQQEMFIKQLQAKSVEGNDQLNQNMETVVELQTQIKSMHKSLHDREQSLKNKEKELEQLKDKSATESEVLKTKNDANTKIIHDLQGQLQSMLDENKQLTGVITIKESELQQKVNDCDQLRARFTELEDAALQLRNQVKVLTSESTQLKGLVKEKEQIVLEIQTNFLSHCEDSKAQINAKEEECNCLKAQLAESQETLSKREADLSAVSPEIIKLRDALADKELGMSAQTKALQEKLDEATLFKAQFMESTELVSQLQDQIKELSQTEEEKQSAFLNLQEKYAAHLEELHDVKIQLSQRNEEMANLNKALSDRSEAVQAAGDTADALRSEVILLQDKLQLLQASNAKLSQQKVDALAAHQTNAASLTVEIERLKSQHLQVASQMNALTENIEQRELALHAINNQYSAQVKHAEYLVTEMQKLDEQNKKLREESSLAAQHFQQQLGLSTSEKEQLQQELKKVMNEKEELIRHYNSQVKILQEQFSLKSQQHLTSTSEAVEKMKTEKEDLQVQLEDTGKQRSEIVELTQKKLKYEQHTKKDVNKYESELTKLRAEKDQLQSECRALREQQSPAVGGWSSEAQLHASKENVAPLGKDPPGQMSLLTAERAQLQRDLQRCLQEIQQRDLNFQQLNAKMQLTLEEKVTVSSQLKSVSQTLRDTQLTLGQLQNRCYWLEGQVQSHHQQDQAKGPVAVEVPPGAPQERSNVMVDMEGLDTRELQSRLAEMEQQLDCSHQDVVQLTESLAEEQARRQAAEEALSLAEERVKSIDSSISNPREFSIQLESDDEARALIINPNEHVVMRKVKGGVHSCRRWLHGRSLYCSKLLTSRAKSRYLFLTYLLALHVLVFMCLSGSL